MKAQYEIAEKNEITPTAQVSTHPLIERTWEEIQKEIQKDLSNTDSSYTRACRQLTR